MAYKSELRFSKFSDIEEKSDRDEIKCRVLIFLLVKFCLIEKAN